MDRGCYVGVSHNNLLGTCVDIQLLSKPFKRQVEDFFAGRGGGGGGGLLIVWVAKK